MQYFISYSKSANREQIRRLDDASFSFMMETKHAFVSLRDHEMRDEKLAYFHRLRTLESMRRYHQRSLSGQNLIMPS